MNIIRKSPDKYGLMKVGKNCHRIVKVLKEYDNEQQAVNELTRLMVGEITEQELVGGNGISDIEAGKLSNRILCLEAALEGIRNGLIQAMGDGDKLEKATREAVKRINDLVEGRKEV